MGMGNKDMTGRSRLGDGAKVGDENSLMRSPACHTTPRGRLDLHVRSAGHCTYNRRDLSADPVENVEVRAVDADRHICRLPGKGLADAVA